MTEKENLIKEFENEMNTYEPNWKNIVDRNADIITVDVFAERMQKIRMDRNLTYAQMAQRLSYSRQAVFKIEKKQIKKIPVDRLEIISYCFSVSIAYLLGITNEETRTFDKTEYYFYEYPNNRYLEVKDKVIRNRMIYAMETWGPSIEQLNDRIIKKLKGDYELLTALDLILDESNKRDYLVSIIKNLGKILLIQNAQKKDNEKQILLTQNVQKKDNEK